MKKILIVLFILLISTSICFADIAELKIPKPSTLTKENFTYTADMKVSSEANYFFGIIKVQSVKEPKYSYSSPVYAIKLDEHLEGDIQWMFINKIEFKDNETISITDQKNHIFELNIDTLEVKCLNTNNNLFKFIHSGRRYECISGNVNALYEKDFNEFFTRNKNHKYTGTQPEIKKLTKLDDIVNTAEQALFQIYDEDQIKGEQPYNISKYKNKWIVQGSLPKDYVGGVFEIIIDADTSRIESVIHGE